MKVAKAKGRLCGKQPKLKPNQAKHLLELHDSGSYTQAELAELFGVGRSTVYRTIERIRPSHLYPSGHSQISPIIKGEPATRGPTMNQRPAGRAAEGPYRVRRASAPARQSTTCQMRNGYRGEAGRWHGRNPPCVPGVCQLGVRSHCRQS